MFCAYSVLHFTNKTVVLQVSESIFKESAGDCTVNFSDVGTAHCSRKVSLCYIILVCTFRPKIDLGHEMYVV